MIKPLGHNLLVEELPRAPHSDGGIFYPDSFEDTTLRCMVYRVVQAGPSCDPDIKPGDRVVLDQFRLSAKSPAGKGLWIIQETSVSVVIPQLSVT